MNITSMTPLFFTATPVKVTAAALAVPFVLGLLSTVAAPFNRDDAPFAQVVAAGRVCADHVHVIDRDACERIAFEAGSNTTIAAH